MSGHRNIWASICFWKAAGPWYRSAVLDVSCFPSSPRSAEVPVELNVPWTAQASKHCWDTSPVKEPPTKQLSQVLSFRTRQLDVLIHLFCSAVPSHMFLLGCCLFCAGSSSLCPSSQGCSSHAVCDTPYLQCSGAQGDRNNTWL